MARHAKVRLFRHCLVSTLLIASAGGLLNGQSSPPPVRVTSAASYQSAVAPESLAALFGTSLVSDSGGALPNASGAWPTELNGISVEVNNRKAGILFVTPEQIDFWVPAQTETGSATVTAKRPNGTVIASATVEVRRTAPALFSADSTGRGPGTILNSVIHQLEPFVVQTPENPGEDKRTRLTMYGTGLRFAGPPDSRPADGNVAAYVKVQTTNGADAVNLTVEYAGPAPYYSGLDQVDVVLPASLDGEGIVTVTLATEDLVSNGVTMKVWSMTSPVITSFSPMSLPPGAPLTITGTSFANGLPAGRNRIIFDAGGGLSATVLPLGGDSTTLRTLVPALANSMQSEWYRGPVSVCVETDGRRTCAPQPLLILEPTPVSGQPGELLVQFVERTNQAVIDSLQALGNTQAVENIRQSSALALQNLRQKIADALAGNPQSNTVTLENGSIVAVPFDVAAIRKLEALLSASQPALDDVLHSMEERVQSMQERTATRRARPSVRSTAEMGRSVKEQPTAESAAAFTEQQQLMDFKTLHQSLDDMGKFFAVSQTVIAGAALVGCVAFPPSCFVLAEALSLAQPVFIAATITQVAGVATIEMGPNSLESLSTVPSGNAEIPVWEARQLSVQGHFIASLDTSQGIEYVAKKTLSGWINSALGLGFATSFIFEQFVDPVIAQTVGGMLDLGLRDLIRIDGRWSRDVPLDLNAVNAAYGNRTGPVPGGYVVGASSEAGQPFWITPWQNICAGDPTGWCLVGLQGMTSSERADFWADERLLWSREDAPTTSLMVHVTSADQPNCAAFPDKLLVPFQSVYYTSTASANGDRVVVANPKVELRSALGSGGTYPLSPPSLRLPRFTGERYCSPVQLAPGCTADAYVPSPAERAGDFSSFAGTLFDPRTARPGPGGTTIMTPLPMNMIPPPAMGPGGFFAWRVRSVQGCGL